MQNKELSGDAREIVLRRQAEGGHKMKRVFSTSLVSALLIFCGVVGVTNCGVVGAAENAVNVGEIPVQENGVVIAAANGTEPIVRVDKIMPEEVEVNEPFDYVITITNLIDATLPDIVVTEEISTGFVVTKTTPKPTEERPGRLVWQIESLGPNASRDIIISGVATERKSLKHLTTVVTRLMAVSAKVRVVEPVLELLLEMPELASVGDRVPVKLVLKNVGTGAARDVNVVDTLPEGLETISGDDEILLEAGTIAAGESREFSTELVAKKAGEYVHKAVASSVTGLKAESAAVSLTATQPVLAITKIGPERQYVGRYANYEMTVANRSGVPAKNVVVEASIPSGVTSIRATRGAKLTGAKKIVWKLGTLSPDASRKLNVSYKPGKDGMLTSEATVTARGAEPVSASVETSVTGISAIMLEVVDADDPVEVGGRSTYVITVTNQGSAAATNVGISCTMEENVQHVYSAGPTSSSVKKSTVKFVPLASLEPGAKASWRVIVSAVKAGDTLFKVSMTSDQLPRAVEEAEATHVFE